jgi:hypothetical protein
MEIVERMVPFASFLAVLVVSGFVLGNFKRSEVPGPVNIFITLLAIILFIGCLLILFYFIVFSIPH